LILRFSWLVSTECAGRTSRYNDCSWFVFSRHSFLLMAFVFHGFI